MTKHNLAILVVLAFNLQNSAFAQGGGPQGGPPAAVKQFMSSELNAACGAELQSSAECSAKIGPEKGKCLAESGAKLSVSCDTFLLQRKKVKEAKDQHKIKDMTCSYNGTQKVDASDASHPVCTAEVSCQEVNATYEGLSFTVPVFCRPSRDNAAACPMEPKQCLREMGPPGEGPHGGGHGPGPRMARDSHSAERTDGSAGVIR